MKAGSESTQQTSQKLGSSLDLGAGAGMTTPPPPHEIYYLLLRFKASLSIHLPQIDTLCTQGNPTVDPRLPPPSMQWILGYATKGAELAWLSVSPESLLVPATLQ